MSEHYYQLTIQDNLFPALIEETKKEGWDERHDFTMRVLPRFFFKNSLLFQLILKFNGTPAILKMERMTWYNWHVDTVRQCSINMLISGEDSQCFFGEKVNSNVMALTELIYKPNTYYLLNTQTQHAVLNRNNMRYMLSIGFDSRTTYELILAECKTLINKERI